MYRTPSSRRQKRPIPSLNLIPILDSVFILVFFLLASAQFVNIKEISSDIPIISSKSPPPKKKKELALTLAIYADRIDINIGIPSRRIKSFSGTDGKDYDLLGLHNYLIQLKKNNLSEETAVFEPEFDISYEELVKIMDTVRLFSPTDEGLFRTNKDGVDEKLSTLFANIIFGNVMS